MAAQHVLAEGARDSNHCVMSPASVLASASRQAVAPMLQLLMSQARGARGRSHQEGGHAAAGAQRPPRPHSGQALRAPARQVPGLLGRHHRCASLPAQETTSCHRKQEACDRISCRPQAISSVVLLVKTNAHCPHGCLASPYQPTSLSHVPPALPSSPSLRFEV